MMYTNSSGVPATAAASGIGTRQQAVTNLPASQVVPKPVPQSQVQDARAYQIQQLRKRFSPKETVSGNGVISLAFKLVPSDPDFPFDLAHLEVELKVPASYPKGAAAPSLSVKNKDIPRGFAVNIERGWDRLVEERKGKEVTLLSLTNALDKNLESLLSQQKAKTVKMTIFKDTRHLESPSTSSASDAAAAVETATVPRPSPKASPAPPRQERYAPEETFTREQIGAARTRRVQETRQIEARMGRMPSYQKSSDGIVYTLPLEPRRRSELPAALQGVQSFQLIVPLLYPLQPIRILLNEVDECPEVEALEDLFAEKATAAGKQQQSMTLMSHVNSLTQTMHQLARQAQGSLEAARKARLEVEEAAAAAASQAGVLEKGPAAQAASVGDGKGHVHVIPRPPEWLLVRGQDGRGSGSSGSEDDEYDFLDGSDTDEGGAAVGASGFIKADANVTAAAPTAERGVAITFPSVELLGIELLQISSLSIGVKCLRCKAANEIGGLRAAGGDGGGSANDSKVASCRKCATQLTARFRPEMVHQNSTRAGFLDLEGCTVTDLLPSTFIPTCSKCSTPTAQGLVSVRGETTTNVCRECHSRFTFKIPDVRFQTYTATSSSLPPTTGPRRRLEKLGLHAGEPLPQRGACGHYRRSYRWFRFSCCGRVFPCDRCHDEAASSAGGDGHPNEWANRMICGWCSREQNYRVESCGFCGRGVVGRKGTGYWEGGKGTRDQVLMRRNDRRKHKRIGGGGAEAARRKE